MARPEVPARFREYVRGKELGQGASSRVVACMREDDSEEAFAAKAIDLRRLKLGAKADSELKKLRREVGILRLLPTHPNLVRFVDAFEEGDFFFLILEYVGGGDLFNALMRRSGRGRPRFKEVESVFLLRQLMAGLGFLHAQGVIHRDLKLENVLVVRERKVPPHVFCDIKITDFGLSKTVGTGFSDARSAVGTPRYVAPEVLGAGVQDFRVDLWSLGIMLYVFLAGSYPLDGPELQQQPALDAVVGKLDASPGARAVILSLLQVQRELRWSLDEVAGHAWLGATVEPPGKKTRVSAPRDQTSPATLSSDEGTEVVEPWLTGVSPVERPPFVEGVPSAVSLFGSEMEPERFSQAVSVASSEDDLVTEWVLSPAIDDG